MADPYPDGQHHEPPRSARWPHVEKAVLAANPHCACCGPAKAVKGRQVHHVLPFHYCVALGRPDLELDPRNLIVLCETEAGDPEANHHLLLGHLGNFKSDNVHVADDVALFAGMDAAAIQADPRWLARKAARLKLLPDMTEADRADFRALMDAMFPPAAVAA
jgi:hypothetical protein